MRPPRYNWGMICHAAAIPGLVVPFGNILGPLLVWLMKKDEFPFVDRQGREALNFQISMTIYAIAALVVGLMVKVSLGLLAAVLILDGCLAAAAAMKAWQGESYLYPLTIRFLH